MALIVAENRKKAWSAVRGLEVIFRDKLTAAVADRWAEWFGSNEYDPLDVAKVRSMRDVPHI